MRKAVHMKNYIKLIRVKHYIKNLLVLAALACSGQLFVREKLFAGLAGFGAFCMISSVVYIINDIRDREKDRQHPTKCTRPIASGAVSVKAAGVLAVLLFVIAGVLNYFAFSIPATVLLALYLILNLAYSLGLKNIPIVDVAILVSGFLIRVLYGALVTGIDVSNWLYFTVVALSFYFALGKRRNELSRLGSDGTRKVLSAYPVSFLDKTMYMCLTLAIVFYSLWSMDERTVSSYNKYLIFTVPIVLLIVMKYNLDVEGDYDGDPVEVLTHDKVLMLMCALYFAMMFIILYI